MGKSFFKVYLPHLSSKRLRIPVTFLTHMEAETSETFTLTGPSGKVWNVHLIESADSFFFEEGWPVFVRDHNIKLGDFLVFRKVGNLKFKVHVYDSSECEKESAYYAISSQDTTCSIRDKGEKRRISDEVVKVLNDSSHKSCESLSKRNRRTEATVPCVSLHSAHKSTSRKKMGEENELVVNSNCLADILYPRNTNLLEPSDSKGLHVVSKNPKEETDEDESVEILGVSPPNESDLHSKQHKNDDVPINISTTHSRRKGTVFFIPQQTERAIESAKAFKSKHPFYVLVLRPSYLKSGFSVIPQEFVRRYMPRKCMSLKLKVSNAKTWPVGYIFSQRASRSKLSRGWLTFARENNLKAGDVCVFELINKVDIFLKVSIFRFAEM